MKMHLGLAVVAISLMAACQLLSPKAEDGLPVPAGGPVEADCGTAIEGIDPLANGDVVIFGEVHGSNELPDFVGSAACQLANSPRSVLVALEVPAEEQKLLDAYWKDEEAAKALYGSEFWTYKFQDGRRSKAMARLIANLRTWRLAGMDIGVRFVDAELPGDRDESMAQTIVSLRKRHPDHLILFLVGNVHAKTIVGTPWNEDYTPAAIHIRDEGLDVLSLNAKHGGGETWMCTGAEVSSCGANSISGNGGGSGPSISIDGALEDGYDGGYFVGDLTASPPQSGPR
jgi:hypothetical protein